MANLSTNSANNSKTLKITGYANVFYLKNANNHITLPGAFRKACTRMTGIRFLWQHDHSKPLGKITKLIEDDYGLYIEAMMPLKIKQTAEFHELLKIGAINGLSICYKAQNTFGTRYQGKQLTCVKEADVLEASVVTIPGNPGAVISKFEVIETTAGS